MPKVTYLVKRFTPDHRRIIVRANEVLEEYAAQGFVLTLRQLYYQFVARGWIPNKLRSYKLLGKVVGDGRLAGKIDWDHLEDRTRNLRLLQHFTGAQDALNRLASWYHVDMWEGQKHRPEVWVEKDALVGVLSGVCDRYDIPYFSCRGYTSLSEMYGASLRLNRWLGQDQLPYIIHLGDHDPSGVDMSRDIFDRLQKTFMSSCEFIRVALTMDQIREYNPPPNPAKFALSLDTLLPTTTGWTTIEEVGVGDELFGSDGRPYQVIRKSEVFYGKPCLEFTFSGGDKVVCSDDHLWDVDGRGRAKKIRSASEIAQSWCEGVKHRPVYRVRVAKPIQTSEVSLPIPPYVFGAWLGDGNSDAEGFACGLEDEETLDLIRQEGFEVRRKPSHPVAVTIYKLRGKLYALGVAHNKHIPDLYLRSSIQQRIHLLQGLMDTDGTVSENRGAHPCSYGSSRQGLAYNVLELVNSLGFRGRVSESRAVLNGIDYGPTWRVEFYPGDTDVFRLSRKRQRLSGVRVHERQEWRTILNVRRVESVPTQCLEINSPDHLFLAGFHFIPTHNTDSRYRAYVDKFGDESWELDALEPKVMSSLIEDRLNQLIDRKQWDSDQAEKEQVRGKLVEVASEWEEIGKLKGKVEEGDTLLRLALARENRLKNEVARLKKRRNGDK